jgi:hypothetical protein
MQTKIESMFYKAAIDEVLLRNVLGLRSYRACRKDVPSSSREELSEGPWSGLINPGILFRTQDAEGRLMYRIRTGMPGGLERKQYVL